MNPLLLVCNPRNIVECVDSIRRLPVDQAWLTGYREHDLVDIIDGVVREHDEYTHILACSDDAVIPAFALHAVLCALEDEHPVVTGYSNLDAEDMRVNLTRRPFTNTHTSTMEDYDLYHLSDVLGWPGDIIPTFFAGYALTGMNRDTWMRYGYRSDGVPSDFNLACRLQSDSVPVVACKQAFMWHVKEKINLPDREHRKRLLIGEVEPTVSWHVRVAA